MDNEVIEQAAKVLSAHRISVGDFIDGLEWDDMPDPWQDECRDAARALHDAGLLADPAALEAAHRKGFYEGADSVIREELADPADRDERRNEAYRAQLARADRAEAEVARLTARLGDCHCDLNPATTDGPHEDCPQHGRRYAEWVVATDAKGAQVADLREWRRKILDVMGYDDTPEYAEELLTYLPVWKAEGEADREHITELRATVEKVREIHQQHACTGYPDCMILYGGQCAHHGHCNHCRKTWPCPTIAALDGAGEQ